MRQELITIRVYRANPDDLGIQDVPYPGLDLAAAEEAALLRLKTARDDPRYQGRDAPIYTDLVREDGSLAVKFRMTQTAGIELVYKADNHT